MNIEMLDKAQQFVKQRWPEARPDCGLVLGSGWSEVAEAFAIRDTLAYDDIPGLGAPGVAGHHGRLVWCETAGLETFVFQGRRHWYEGEGWTPIALPLYLLKQAGATRVCLTNAAGGINHAFKPGDLMIIDDHINLIGSNPLIGPRQPAWGPRFPDMSRVYDSSLRAALERAGRAINITLQHGVYLAVSGPSYETPAEIRAFRALGADAVGMSTVSEAILANAAGLRVVGLSCITNLAAGVTDTPLSHEEVTATTQLSMSAMKAVIMQLWKEMAHEPASGAQPGPR